MLLRELAPFGTLQGDGSTAVTGVSHDSRHVQPGDLFAAIVGAHADGHHFVKEAQAKGAIAVMAQQGHPMETDLPVLWVDSTRRRLAEVSAMVYGHPSHALRVIGVTGTNGKSTTTFLLRHLLEAAGRRVGLIGTLGAFMDQEVLAGERTTPEACDVQRIFSLMRARGIEDVVMEVSSHALTFGRVDAVRFVAAVFTNLTQDHLDFHETMEAYRAAKGLLFSRLEPESLAVLNADEEASAYFRSITAARIVTYGLSQPADVCATDVKVYPDHLSFKVVSGGQTLPVELPLIGRFNVENALAALTAARDLGVDLAEACAALNTAKHTPGRFERVEGGQPFSVIVDYAHSPDGLLNALNTVREVASGRIIVVFGCGGDRDRGKRPQMGRIAGTLADHVIVTSDNPRSEDPWSIVKEVAAGVAEGTAAYDMMPDRRQAIEAACRMATAGDVVLIAGKGHETTQTFADRVVYFDDRVVALEALSRR